MVWGVYSIANATIWVANSIPWRSWGRRKLSSCESSITSFNGDNIEKVKKNVLEHRRVGIREVAEALNNGYEARHRQTRTERPGFFEKRTSSRSREIMVILITTIMRRHIPAWLWLNFWLNTKQNSLLSYRIRQIWLPVTFSCFQKSNIRSGERAINQLRP